VRSCGAILQALDRWEDHARQYFADMQKGLEKRNAAPQTEEERREQFEIKRTTVNHLAEQALIQKDRQLKMTFRLDLLALAQRYASVDRALRVGTYSDRRELTNFAWVIAV
jgi:hypothetical protein